MTQDKDHVRTETDDGELKNKRTSEPEFESISVDEHVSIKSSSVGAALSGHVVPVGDGLGVSDAIDPSTTTTPVSDAAQLLRDSPGDGWSGQIILPPGRVDQATPVTLEGHGGFVSPGPSNAEIRFTNDTKGLVLGEQGHTMIRGGLTLRGPGWTTGTQPAIYCARNGPWHIWDYIETVDWGGESLLTQYEPFYFANIGIWRARRHDPAQSGTNFPSVIDNVGGKSSRIDTVILSNSELVPSGTTPGGFSERGHMSIGTLEVLGDIGSDTAQHAFLNATENAGVFVDYLNAETLGLNTPQTNIGIRAIDSAVFCNRFTTVDQDTWHAALLDSASDGGLHGGRIPRIDLINGSSTQNRLTVVSEPSSPIEYDGLTGEINNAVGSSGWAFGIDCADGYFTG